MHSCTTIQRQLPQYIADGEPPVPIYAALRAHLVGCADCAAYASRLRVVEDALVSYPLALAPQDLGERVRAIANLEAAPREEQWHLWQPDLGIPVMAFILALMIAVLALPPNLAPWAPLADWAKTPVMQPQALPTWPSPGDSVFWAVWIGISATAAGLGISVSLAGWKSQHSRRVNEFESQVSDLANRVWQIRRAR